MKEDLFLVIDMQNVYGEGGQWCCGNTKKASENILKLLKSKKDMDIIFTKFLASEDPVGVWKQYNLDNAEVNQDPYANEMMAELKEESEKYPMYIKSTYSSLTIPEVLKAARKTIHDEEGNSSKVVVSGVVAECCVLATVMALIDEGCKVIYLTDAVAGIDDDTEQAVCKVLQGLSPLHVEFMTTDEYLLSGI
ncbi:MAG: cysteine hydrolase [Dorea sp.]|nr:cysteine hydrolase [Dorea sp.]